MPSADDARVLESTAVRRDRVREAFLWGSRRRQAAVGENLKRVAIGLIITGVIAAGCVGWALVRGMIAKSSQKSGAGEIRVIRTVALIPDRGAV